MKIYGALSCLFLATMSALPAMGKDRPAIVLVHGAWETATVWSEVAAGLKRDGYKVHTIELPGRPGNELPIQKVTFDGYREAVSSAIAHEKEPVVLVGHSFGGFVISAEAEAQPKRIKTLVYVAAYLPQDGQSLLGLATTDPGSKAGAALVIEKEKGLAAIKYDSRGGLFANDAPAEVAGAVAIGIVDEPLAPLATPVHLSKEKFGSVDKVYIHTARDQVVSPPFQAAMVKATPVRLELSVDTGHTPFITNPPALIAAIEKAAD
ncbi:alpha/beta fold hydrolase [Bradyrhizobium sp. 48]|uniref:alpha/beta fold hydrolase n=1 Tax=Bradyrhizobium sp. 48 TaxID=2782676 RepID=UPI001FFA2DD0|nr:alpha/beta fold hydrolase [Bradyrhizobium sp. 48]MCK1446709.1 alpha/beta fold hydrolase [Bradyrhizobium sp. 48]